MLIQKMLGKHNVAEYSIAITKEDDNFVLLRFLGHGEYLDIKHHKSIFYTEIIFKKFLKDYIENDKDYISDKTAKILAKQNIDKFANDYFEYAKNNEEKSKQSLE